MGVCGTTNSNKKIFIERNENFDFDTFKNEINDKSEIQKKGFLLKARLWEITEGSRKTVKSLISKYFFFEPNGTFISKVKPFAAEQITYTGTLSEQGVISMKSEQKGKRVKTYEGVIDNNFKVNGIVKQDSENNTNTSTQTFEFDLKPEEWKIDYINERDVSVETFNACVRYKFKESVITGISKDSRGVLWLWCGYEGQNNEVNIVQRKVRKGYSDDEKDEGVISMKGKIDKISFTIRGTVNMGEAVKFHMKSLKVKKNVEI
jgi:hypothetical protein